MSEYFAEQWSSDEQWYVYSSPGVFACKCWGDEELAKKIANLLNAKTDLRPAGSHHGSPDLTRHDIELLEAYTKWVETARGSKIRGYEANWLPSYPDWIKSRLFWRIRSGQKPLKYPPPRAYSCPWYELIEVPGPHDVSESIREYPCDPNQVTIAQCLYQIVTKTDDHWILGYGPYRFKAWNGMTTRKKLVDKGVAACGWIEYQDECGWIEYIGESEEKTDGV